MAMAYSMPPLCYSNTFISALKRQAQISEHYMFPVAVLLMIHKTYTSRPETIIHVQFKKLRYMYSMWLTFCLYTYKKKINLTGYWILGCPTSILYKIISCKYFMYRYVHVFLMLFKLLLKRVK